MFNLFKNKKSKYPSFRVLKNFHKRNFYFLRNAEWVKLDEESILVTSPRSGEVLTLTGWQRLIFLSAVGEHTIEQFIYFLADQYTTEIPFSLDHIVIFEFVEMERINLISLTAAKQMLPKEFELPGMGGAQ
jgi:hypothetical protein